MILVTTQAHTSKRIFSFSSFITESCLKNECTYNLEVYCNFSCYRFGGFSNFSRNSIFCDRNERLPEASYIEEPKAAKLVTKSKMKKGTKGRLSD